MRAFATLILLFLTACAGTPLGATDSNSESNEASFSVSDDGVKTKNVDGFGGIIAKRYDKEGADDAARDADVL